MWRSYIDTSGQETELELVGGYETIELTGNTSTWKKVLADLPAGFIEDGSDDIIYYNYYVKEIAVDGYTTEITEIDDFTFNITNSSGWQEILPDKR